MNFLKKIINNENKFLNLNRLIYISIFILYAGFIINGCILKLANNISSTCFNICDMFLFFVECLILAFTLSLLLIKRPKFMITTYLSCFFLIILDYFFFQENLNALLPVMKDFILYGLTTFVLFMEIKNDKDIFVRIVRITKVIFLFALIYTNLLLNSKQILYNQWLSGHYLVSAIFTLYDYKKYKSNSSLIVSILSFILLFLTGSRSYLLIYILFLIILLFPSFYQKIRCLIQKNKKKFIFYSSILIVLLVILLTNYRLFANSLFNFFESKGITIRILRLIATGNFFTSNERINILYPFILKLIKNNWLFGIGIAGDRIAIFNFYEQLGLVKDGLNCTSYYAHNIILELFASFGILISIILIFLFCYSLYKKLVFKNKNNMMILCLVFVSILPLMVSGSFWDNVYFWSLLAFLFPTYANYKTSLEPKVFMLLDNAFTPDIRVYKEASYLTEKKLDVTVLCLDRKNEFINQPEENFHGVFIKRFFCRTEKMTKLIEKNKLVAKLKMCIYFYWLLTFIHKCQNYMKQYDFSIIHCHDLTMAFMACLFFKDKDIIFDMHEFYGNKNNKLYNFLITKVAHYTQNRSKWIIYVNDYQKQHCSLSNMEKLIFLPNYPDSKMYKNILKTSSNKLRISYIGMVRDYFSLKKLLDLNSNNKMEIAIYGRGSIYNKLREYALSINKENILKGSYDGLKDSCKIYNNTDILYAVYDIASDAGDNWQNAIPVKAYEGILTLTPIIATKGSALGKMVLEKNIGFVIDIKKENELENLLNKLIKKPNIIDSKIKNLKKIQYLYTWDNVVINLDKIYFEGDV